MNQKYKVEVASMMNSSSDPDRWNRVMLALLMVGLLVLSLYGTDFHLGALLNSHSLTAALEFFDTFWPPRADGAFLQRLLYATVTTVSIATVSTVLAMTVAAPLALIMTSRLSLSSRGRPMRTRSRAVRVAVRGLMLFLRSVPELIWALLFVGITGLGATAGIMGLLLTNIGILAKNYAEIIESGDANASGNLLDNGSGRTKTLFFATLPECQSELLSYSIYRWECTLRTSVVLGFVGAGGLGQELLISIRQLASPEVFSIILVFVVLVACADAISASLRRQLVIRSATSNSHNPSMRYDTSRQSYLRGMVVGVLIMACFYTVDWQVVQWLKPSSLARSQEFIMGFFPPDTSLKLWLRLAGDAVETMSMAFAGTSLASLFALWISYSLFVSQQGQGGIVPRALLMLLRWAQIILRAIPELVWAMLLVIVAGIGPFTGTLALFLASVGVLSRLYSECLENQDSGPRENLIANGGRLGIVPLWSTFVQARSQLISYTLYRWEHNLRAATLMGIVGAGGVGQELYLRLSVFQFDRVAACILVIVTMVALVDSISHTLRHRYASTA